MSKKRKKNTFGPVGKAKKQDYDPAKLSKWQDRLAESNTYWSAEVDKMDEREKVYNGDRELKPLTPNDTNRKGGNRQTSHVRNIVFENIESQVSSSIPAPKVTPRRKEDEPLAEIIERFLRNELDRLPFETMNDMAERTVPIQGGVGFLTEWDNTKRTHTTVGEVSVNVIHPKQFAPQPGVYTGIEAMDWFIIKVPTTKESIKRKYGKSVYLEGESEPEVRTVDPDAYTDDAVTEYIGYERNANGGIDRYCWVNNVELENLENYQARRQPVCARCGRVRPLPGQIINNEQLVRAGNLLPDPARGFSGGLIPAEILEREVAGQMMAQQLADGMLAGESALDSIQVQADEQLKPQRYDGGPCPWCGSEKFTSKEQEFEQVMLPIKTIHGEIPSMRPGLDEWGNPVMKPTMIPFYKPDLYPIILQRSVSVYGKLLGNSDVDMIRDQQNTVNRMEQKIITRLIKAGTRVTLPDKANLRMDSEDGEKWYIGNAADKALIGVYDFKGDLKYEIMYLANVYEEARQILGITDSFQGRKDTTATSGKAKEFAAAQSAGRLESKRVMKNAAYAALFEMMFKFWLAYSDEPRPVSYKNFKGETEYEEFNRYDFLERDSNGEWFWNDQFLFSCDTSAPLASNREAMWQETRMNLQQGAFGDPKATQTLILFWSKMEELHYPGAASTKKYLEERLGQEKVAQAQMRAAQMAAGAPMAGAGTIPAGAGNANLGGLTAPQG